MPDHESSQVRRAQRLRSYDGNAHVANPTASRRRSGALVSYRGQRFFAFTLPCEHWDSLVGNEKTLDLMQRIE